MKKEKIFEVLIKTVLCGYHIVVASLIWDNLHIVVKKEEKNNESSN